MLRVLLLCGFVSCAHASDDASLMQQGVGVTSMTVQRRFSTSELQSRIHEIGTELQNMPYPGQIRQMALDSLMKSMSEADTMTSDLATLANDIIVLLEGVLSDYRSTNSIQQGLWNDALRRSTDCNELMTEKDGQWSGNVSSTKNDHEGCRTQQKGLFDLDQLECGRLQQFLQGVAGKEQPECNKPAEASADNVQAWTDFLNDGYVWFNAEKTAFDPLHANCSKAEGDLLLKFSECNDFQKAYEHNYCGYFSHRNAMCTARSNCFTNSFNPWWQNFVDVEVPAGERRLAEAKIVRRINCLLLKLANQEDIAADDCPAALNNTESDSDYSLVEPNKQDELACDRLLDQTHPSNSTWDSDRYGAIDVMTEPTLNDGVSMSFEALDIDCA